MTRHHTLFTSITDIQAWIENTQLSDREREVAEGALGLIRKQWARKRREEYERGLAKLTKQDGDLFRELNGPLCDKVERLKAALVSGVTSPADGYAQYRDLDATRQRLTVEHRTLVAQDDLLEALHGESAEEYQARSSKAAQYRDRIHGHRVMPADEMTFGAAIDEFLMKEA